MTPRDFSISLVFSVQRPFSLSNWDGSCYGNCQFIHSHERWGNPENRSWNELYPVHRLFWVLGQAFIGTTRVELFQANRVHCEDGVTDTIILVNIQSTQSSRKPYTKEKNQLTLYKASMNITHFCIDSSIRTSQWPLVNLTTKRLLLFNENNTS